MAKARKGARKAAPRAKKATTRKSARKPAKRAAVRTSSKELDLGPLKKQIRQHIEKLSKASSTDRRSQDALTSLQRVQQELSAQCLPTMVIPLA